jgi:hypothetical protein
MFRAEGGQALIGRLDVTTAPDDTDCSANDASVILAHSWHRGGATVCPETDMKRILTTITVALGAFLLNPMVACQSEESEPEFTYGETEVRAAVTGTYQGTLAGTGETITVTLDEATASNTTATQSLRNVQCGTRSFIKPAAACVSMTQMAVIGTLTASNGSVPNGNFTGTFSVYSRLLTTGDLSLTTASGDSLRATYNADANDFTNWVYTASGSTSVVNLTLARVTGN